MIELGLILLVGGFGAAMTISFIVLNIVSEQNKGKPAYEWKSFGEGMHKWWAVVVVCVVLGIIGCFILGSNGGDSTHTSASVTCGHCGKKYNATSSNGKNIRRTNLCNSCYAFYNSASHYLNEQPLN